MQYLIASLMVAAGLLFNFMYFKDNVIIVGNQTYLPTKFSFLEMLGDGFLILGLLFFVYLI